METFLQVVLASVLNLRTADWDTPFPGVRYSTALTLISLILVGLVVPCLLALYCWNFKILAEDQFKSKYGAGLEGTKLAKKVSPRSILLFPVSFFGRRILFAVSTVFLEDFLWA